MNKNKFYYILAIVISTVLFIAAVGITSVITAVDIIEETSYKELKLSAQNACQEFDANIRSIEQCVDTLALAATSHMDDFEEFKTNPDYVDAYTEELRNLILYSVQNTQGALSIYIRYNKEFTEPTSGLFLVYDEDSGDYVEHPVTDLSQDSDENTVWYDLPVENGEPTWLKPYKNTYKHYDLISYVVPYYIEEELVGIIGIDINVDYIEEFINSIKVYDTGYAFLVDDTGKVVVHKDHPFLFPIASDSEIEEIKSKYKNDTEQGEYATNLHTVLFSKTQNDLILCVSARNREIYKFSRVITFRVVIIELVALFVMSILATIIIKKLFRMSEIDILTGTYNRRYFVKTYNEMNPDDLYKYSLFIFDIDKFKNINDTFGHNIGDKAIANTAGIVKEKIGESGILARWGGDEFIGIIRTNFAESVLMDIRQTIENQENPEYGKLTISIGYTIIKDSSNFNDVYDRADQALYESKENGRNRITRK